MVDKDSTYRARNDAEMSGDYANAIVETIHDALVVIDSEGRVLTANRSFCALFRVSRREMRHRLFFGEGAGQCDAPRLRDLFQDVLSKGSQIKDFELDQHFPQIGRRRLVLNARRIGATRTILIAIEDVTERKQAREDLEKRESTIRDLLAATPQAVVAMGEDRKIMFVNAGAESLFGYDQKELLGRPLEILVPENARERHAGYCSEYFATRQSRPMGIGMYCQGRRKDGTIVPLEIGLSGIETAAGKLAVAFVTDITVRKQTEQAARAHTQEVQALAGKLLKALEEERRRLSRELHDQICQELASLAMDLSRLASSPLGEDAQERLKVLQARAVKASEETRHIAYALHPSVLDDLGLVASLRGLCTDFLEQTGVAVEFTADASQNAIPCEAASCLYRVAQESLRNISKHAGAKHIDVALAWHPEEVTLTIADDGAGFDPNAVQGHAGLGLVGMRERARQVNGNFAITARPGGGTRIALKVPLPRSYETGSGVIGR